MVRHVNAAKAIHNEIHHMSNILETVRERVEDGVNLSNDLPIEYLCIHHPPNLSKMVAKLGVILQCSLQYL